MGLKSIEMQVALPRTQDAGKVQEQLQRQGEQLQGTLTQAQLEKEKIKRAKVQQMDHTAEVKNKKESEQYAEEETSKEDIDKDEESNTPHPYLGRRIDFNG